MPLQIPNVNYSVFYLFFKDQESESKEITSSTKEFIDVSTSDDEMPINLQNSTTNRSAEQKISTNQKGQPENLAPITSTNENKGLLPSSNQIGEFKITTNQNAGFKSTANQIAETSEDATMSDAKSTKEWNHQIRDQKFRELIKDERTLTPSADQPKEGPAARRAKMQPKYPPYLFVNRARKPQLPVRRFAPVYKELSGIKKEVVRELKSAENVLNMPFDTQQYNNPKRDRIGGVM